MNRRPGRTSARRLSRGNPGPPDLLRARDLEARGLPRGRLVAWQRSGEIERVSRGLYRRRDAPVTELETIAQVSKRVPRSIVCLLTALHVHGIGTQAPRDVWIAIDRKAWRPRVSGLPVRIVRFSGQMLTYAIQTREVLGVKVRITSPARTVVDCFRYRNKIGLDVALEALRDVIGSRKATIAEIDRASQVCRVRTVIAPYLAAVAS